MARFQPGSHIRVKRPFGYYHHGIYVSDNEVIQFGGRILDKPTATVGAVSLTCFERGRVAEVVQHGRTHPWWRSLLWPRPPWLPEADAPEAIIRRARWLAENHPIRRYNLVGYNCEHAANFCATGWYTESHQVRMMFGMNAVLAFPIAYRFGKRPKAPPSRRWYVFAVVKMLVTLTTIPLYNSSIRRFWHDIGFRWQEYERSQGDESGPGLIDEK